MILPQLLKNWFSLCFVFRRGKLPSTLSYRFLKGGCPRGGGNWGTLRIPREDWGTLGKIREIITPT